ncbi:hypothetical protein [Flavobacterium sp.]|uniref:hypothetical protein n=1 Tax=Flavobacterium sp. TaxID=239 RepID=UPI0039E4E292
MELTKLESEMLDNYDQIKKETDEFVASMNAHGFTDAGIDGMRERICAIWSKIRSFVTKLEALPFIGKYVGLFVTLMDAICPK